MTPPITEIITSTIQSRTRQLADNVANSNALLAKLSAKGRIKTISGGDVIYQELEYAENATFGYYTGYDTLTTTPSTVLSAAEYPWKQAAVVVSASGLEVNVQNTGKERMLNLLEARINNAFKTMANQIAVGIYGTGAGLTITGLQLQVATDPTTGTVAGIDRATDAWWRNQTLGPTTTITASNIQGYMRQLWLNCTRGPDVPDLIPADANFYEYFWESLSDIQRISREDQGKAGWQNLLFLNAEVIYDGDSGITADTMYFLNTDYFFWRPHKDVNMVADTKRIAYNQDAFVVPILFAGNLTMSNASLQGVLWQGS